MEHLRSMWRQASKDVVFNSVSDDPWRWDHYTEKWPPRNLTQRTKRVGEITMHLVDYGDDREIYARIGDRVVGTAYFGYVGADLRAAVQVDPKYRRRGVATAMYVWAEEIARDKLTPDIPHTPLAEALWNQPNRPFGRTASASGLRFETETIINNSVIRLAAYDGDTVVGFLAWDVRFEPGMILSISVDPGYQRRGIATELWNRARVIEPRLHHSDDVTDEGQAWIRSLGAMKDVAYRGVSLQLDARRGVPILEALAKRQTNVAARLIIDAMAETVKDHWWAAGAQESDEAGRWWTSKKVEAEIYAMGVTDAWMTLPVVMTASFEGAEGTGYNDGTYVWHLQAGHPVTITEFEAMLPDDPQHLLDGWRGVTSPGNHDTPGTYWDGTWTKLNVPQMRTTASFVDSSALSRVYERVRNEVFPLLSDAALSDRDRWKDGGGGMKWPSTYLSEASSGEAFRTLQRVLAECGVPETVTMVRDKVDWKVLGLSGTPPFTNASLWEGWLGRSTPDRAIFTVPRSHIVGFGSFGEDEVFVRTDLLKSAQWRRMASSGTYWRVHSKSRPFDLSEAFSVPMSSFGDRNKTNRQARPGFSCMADPWHLWVYCMAMGWLADGYVQNSDVIEFSGRPITKGDFVDLGVPESAIEWMWDGGRGIDREPLVMPDMRTVKRQSWASFEKMLLTTPLPASPQASDVRFNSELSTWGDLAEILYERKGRYSRENGPVVDYLIGKFILSGIGRL